MKTRHLLFATALVASLAACTNDDFTIDKQQPVVDGRPTVSDVKLNFTESGVDTRLAFGKNGYAWEANDTIGALLMDNVRELGDEKTWIEKYELVEYIHTSYPFTYSTADKTWGCNTKMLEGNYFFAFPWESYDGQRQVRHLLTKQEQKGVKSNVVAESYAKNQFFIGYAQIKAGTNAKDALTDVEMTSLLGAVQLRIVNTGTQTYHINKIVLRGSGIMSELTFDPTNAAYGPANYTNKWNLNGNEFNYANYTGNEDDLYHVNGNGEYVYNIEAGDEYDKKAALRAVVQQTGTATSAQLIITGTPEERALVSTKDDAKAMAYALIMANAQPVVGDLMLDIYTDEGLVKGIDLTEINTATGDTYKAITDSKVEEISPEVANTIKVQIDDNSFAIPDKMEVFDGDDLLQFIEWNAKVTGVRTATATLHKDVTLTKEMTDALAKNKNLSLTISDYEENSVYAGNVLTIAADVAKDVLELEKLTINANIEVLGTVALTKKSNKFNGNITVGETGTVNIETDGVDWYCIQNNGTLNINEGVTYKGGQITNNGEMNVAKLADVKANVSNRKDATLNVNGFMSQLTNYAKGTVVMGEGANLANVENHGVIRSAKNAIVAGTNNGEIVYIEGATISATGGTISYETSGKSFGKDAFKDNKVNKLILKRGETKITDNLNIANIEIAEDGALLTVADKKTLKVGTLTVKAVATTKGNIEAANVVVEEDATLTNNGTITATAFDNKGTVANNGKVVVSEEWIAYHLNNTTNWKYNSAEAIQDNTASETYKTALKNMVVHYVNYSNNYKSEYKVTAEKFNKSFETYKGNNEPNAMALQAAMSNANITAVSQADLDEAVEAIVKDNKKAFMEAIKAGTISWTAQATLYDTKDAANPNAKPNPVTSAYDAFRKDVVKGGESTMVGGLNGNLTVFVPALSLTEAEIDALIKEKNPTMFVWKDCDLDKLVKVWMQFDGAFEGGDLAGVVDGQEYADARNGVNDAEKLVKWVTAILNANSTGIPAVKEAQDAIGNLGITVTSVQTFGRYTDDQMVLVE